MPTYEYQCTNCGHIFEAFQAISEEPIRECPECSKPVKRLISGGTGIIFKGSGFYVNDSKKSSTSAKSTSNEKSKKDSAA
ncbi:FmdB family zinc ribbon protein [Spirochaetia bacterium 38H-sp]|uniref:FmdB family zinc ribbon protein n=1 Tax=Rarispira pelagica TaxID=3141764 RepID=A0ABU9UCF9_9SPIR